MSFAGVLGNTRGECNRIMDSLTKHWLKMSLNVREGEELGLDDELSSKNFTCGGLSKDLRLGEVVTTCYCLRLRRRKRWRG